MSDHAQSVLAAVIGLAVVFVAIPLASHYAGRQRGRLEGSRDYYRQGYHAGYLAGHAKATEEAATGAKRLEEMTLEEHQAAAEADAEARKPKPLPPAHEKGLLGRLSKRWQNRMSPSSEAQAAGTEGSEQ